MKKLINNVLTVSGFLLTAALPLSVFAGSFLLFVIGCAGFVLFMKGLLA